LGLTWAIYKSAAKLTPELLVELALVSAIVVPFCLPRMHERYFFLADVLSILAAFLIPALFYAPVVMITVSFFAYQPTLFGAEPLPMGLLALAVLLLLIALGHHTVTGLLQPAKVPAESPTK
jgi:Gpi18-like mannosyltransferase